MTDSQKSLNTLDSEESEKNEKNSSLVFSQWEGTKNMSKDFFDDGTISFFWLVSNFILIFSIICLFLKENFNFEHYIFLT